MDAILDPFVEDDVFERPDTDNPKLDPTYLDRVLEREDALEALFGG